MKTVREVINSGVHVIYCNSGLVIELPDTRCNYPISPPKIIDGKPVFRWIFFTLYMLNNSFPNITSVEHRSLYFDEEYCYFHKNDYIGKEKEVNMLISDNGGIDEYRTF